jgi:hypothetical protein
MMAKKIVKQQHYVTFYSPGTFVAETSDREIKSWDVEAAKKLAHTVTERYGATPYAFQFSTMGRSAKDLNAKEIAKSPLYYLGGRVETLAQIEARNDPKEEILRSNMRCNEWDRVIVNDNSWRVTRPMNSTDVILDWKPRAKKAKAA